MKRYIEGYKDEKYIFKICKERAQHDLYCGNVLSWKTYTYDFWEHKKRKNRKNRKQVLEIDHHEGIVSHEIYDAVQAKLQSDKYTKNHHPFPTLNVIDGGALLGFVPVNRSWRGFTESDYCKASESVYQEKPHTGASQGSKQGSVFNLDGYEIVRTEFFSTGEKPKMTFGNGRVSFNTVCLKRFETVEYVEILINTVEKCVAIRPCSKDSPNAVHWGKRKDGRWICTPRSITGFVRALFEITGWEESCRYRLCGQYVAEGNSQMLLFDLSEPETIRTVKNHKNRYPVNCSLGVGVCNGQPIELTKANVVFSGSFHFVFMCNFFFRMVNKSTQY